MIRINTVATVAATMALVGAGALAGPFVAHGDDVSLDPNTDPVAVAARIVAGRTNTSLVAMPNGEICGWGNTFPEQFGEWNGEVHSDPTPACITLPGDVPATAVSADMHAVALGGDGVAYTWGSIEGAVAYPADGPPAYIPRPVTMPVTTRATAVSAGGAHTAVLTADGAIYMSGSNQYGQRGDGSEHVRGREGETSVGVTAPGVVFTGLSAGRNHTLAVSQEGKVYAWGSDQTGQLGPNGAFNAQALAENPWVSRKAWMKDVPVEVSGLADIVQVAAGVEHSVALTRDGHVYTWGANLVGQLGDGTAGGYSTQPVRVDLDGIVGISAGFNATVAWTTEGRLYAWGDNSSGGLGDGTLNDARAPQEIHGLAVAAASTSGAHSMAIGRDGQIYTWGDNRMNALGSDDQRFTTEPELVAGLPEIASVAAGENITAAVADNGDVYTWGWNGDRGVDEGIDGRLGTGEVPRRSRPAQVEGVSGVIQVDVNTSHAAALTGTGEVWAWGSNESGELGREPVFPNAPVPTPVQVELPADAQDGASVGVGAGITLMRTTAGKIWGWGYNRDDRFGLSEIADSVPTPTEASIGLGVPASALSVGPDAALVLVDSTLHGFESRYSDILGARNPATDGQALPIAGLTDKAIVQADAASSFTMALDSAGHVWTLGSNVGYRFGRPDFVNSAVRETPEQVPDLPEISAVAAGGFLAMALSQDRRTVYTWGSWGQQIPPDAAADAATPVGVSGFPSDIVQIAAGENHAVALTEDGEVYTWGDDYYGQLGTALSIWMPEVRVSGLQFWEPPEPTSPDPSDSGSTSPSSTESTSPGGTANPEPSDSGSTSPSTDPSVSPSPEPSDSRDPNSPAPSDTTRPTPSDSGGEPSEGAAPNAGGAPGGTDSTGPGTASTPDDPGNDSLHASGANASDASHGLGAGAADPGTSSIGGSAPRGTGPRIARFETRFKTVVIPQGTTATLKVAAYRASGSTAGRASVTWWAATPQIASPVKGARTGSMSWRTGSTATVKVAALAVGRTRVTLASAGAKSATIQVKVVPSAKAKAQRLRTVHLTGPATLGVGRSTVLKPALTPLGAVRTAGTWRSTNPTVATVNAVGRVTAQRQGTAVIVLKVQGKTTSKTIAVR
ncbi:MAG: Ig-like domain-containing protein [Bifidobacteriaceae bacterium]|jgi:alpha-tubulin suppressor-like RCC1 family protein|nr:Ig-like domain-containing protein [Bifidobacteriaceae bacterium]